MATSTAKENILKKIRQALINPVPLPFPQSEGTRSVFLPAESDLAVVFAEEFTRLQGNFFYCSSEHELEQQVQALVDDKRWTKVFFKDAAFAKLVGNKESYMNLADSDVAITDCECLVARTGTIVMSAAQQSGRTTSVYAPIHICISRTSQLMYNIDDALRFIKDKYSQGLPSLITFASGPSRTADIEKTLVTGVHGPKEVYCFLVEG